MKIYFNLFAISQTSLGTLSVVLVVLASLFGIFLLTAKTTNKLGNTLLGFYFILMAIDFGSYFYKDIPIWLKLFNSDLASFVSRPLLYLYVLSVLYLDFKLTRKHLLHLLWLVIVIAIMIPWYFTDYNSQLYFKTNYLQFKTGKFIMYFSLVNTQVYLIVIFIVLIRYKKIVIENFSNPNLINYKWLLQMNILLQGFFVLVLIKNLYRLNSENQNHVENTRIILVIFTILFLSWLLFKALNVPQIFRGIDSKLNSYGKIDDGQKTNINAKQVEDLEYYMSVKEPFLDSDLTIQILANQLKIPTRDLSVLINHHFKQHFHDFINTYRIIKAKELLVNTSNKQLSVSEILYKVGFNSKSSFNTAFKKRVGVTPSQYRKDNSL